MSKFTEELGKRFSRRLLEVAIPLPQPSKGFSFCGPKTNTTAARENLRQTNNGWDKLEA